MMPRKRRRSVGEGGIRRREYTRSDGSIRLRYSAIVTADWVDGKQKQVEGPLRKPSAKLLPT